MAANGSNYPISDQHDNNDNNATSSSSSSVSSLPPLVRPPIHDTGSFDVITGYQLESTSLQLYLHSSETQSLGVEHSVLSHNVTTSSESISGISDAPTAHLDSDVDSTMPGVPQESTSSAADRSSSPEAGPSATHVNVEISSTSSLTSNTSPGETDLRQPSCATTRKRTSCQTRSVDPKKAKCEVKSPDTSTSGKETSTSTCTTTASNTSPEHRSDTSHDDTSFDRHDDTTGNRHDDNDHHGDMSHDDRHHGEEDRDNPPSERHQDDLQDCVVVSPPKKSVYRRSDCAEMNVWSMCNTNRKLTRKEQDVVSSQCDLLFDAAEDHLLDDKSSQPLTSTNIYLSLSCVPPSQENYPNISRIRPTSPTDISALIDASCNQEMQEMRLIMSQTQEETQASIRSSKNHLQGLRLQDSQLESILITHDVPASLTQEPSTRNQAQPDLCFDMADVAKKPPVPEALLKKKKQQEEAVLLQKKRRERRKEIFKRGENWTNLYEDIRASRQARKNDNFYVPAAALITHDVPASLTQEPSTSANQDHVIVIGDESSEPTSRFQLERPVITLPETDSSSEGNTSSVMVFRKNATPKKSSESVQIRPECDLDLETEFEIAPSFPSTRLSRTITHLVTSSNMHTVDSEPRQESCNNLISYDEQFTDNACRDVEIENNVDSDLRSVTKASLTSCKNEIDCSEQTVCYDIDSHSADIDIIERKDTAKPSSGQQTRNSQNSQQTHLSATEKHSRIAIIGNEQGAQCDVDKQSSSTTTANEQAEQGVQCDVDNVVESNTDVGRRSKAVVSNATVSCSQSRASLRTRTRRKSKLRKRTHLTRTHFTRIAEKYQNQLKQSERKTERNNVLVSPDQSSISAQRKRTFSQAVQTSLTRGDHILRVTKYISVSQHTLTITEDIVGGKVVSKSVQEKTEIIERKTDVHEEVLSPVSESRSLHSSSADLADVSSISVSSSAGRSKLSSIARGAPLVYESPETASVPVVRNGTVDNVIVIAESLVADTRIAAITLDTAVQCSDDVVVPDSQNREHRSFAAIFASGETKNTKQFGSRRPSVGLVSEEHSKSSSGGQRSVNRRSSSSTYSMEQSKSSSGDKHSVERRSATDLFSADSSESLGRRSIGPNYAALAKCNTVVMDSPNTSVFRLPFPVPNSKRSSTGSSGSRRSSGILLDRSCNLPAELTNDQFPISHNDGSVPNESKSVSVRNIDVTLNNTTCSVNSSSNQCPFDVQQGMSVMAVWSDKHYYPATVLSVDNKKRVHVKFDEDGSLSWVKSVGVVCCGLVPVGFNVLAKRAETNWREPAVVLSYYSDDSSVGPAAGYNVHMNTSDITIRVPKSQISLDKTQMTKLKTYLKVIDVGTVSLPPSVDSIRSEQPQTPPADIGLVAQELLITKPNTIPPAIVSADTPVVESSLKTPVADRGSNRVLSVGSAVYAAWKDKYFYPGYVSEYNDQQQRWVVSFEDGDKFSVNAADIILCELLPLSLDVLALRTNGSNYQEAARIIGYSKSGNDNGYMVEFYADNFHCRVSRKDVSLHPTQASFLIKTHGVNTANHSDSDKKPDSRLRTISTPKRKWKEVTPSRTTSGKRQKAVSSSNVGPHSLAESRQRIKRKLLINAEPGATSTPTTPAAKQRISAAAEDSHECHTPSSKSCVPGTSQPLLAGFTFVITYAGTKQSNADTSVLYGSCTPTSSSRSYVEVTFDKEDIKKKIDLLGGLVVNKLDLESVQCVDKCILISDTYHRTQKYFLALAAGIPCLSHMWIYHSCADGALKSYEPYLLPAGFSLEANEVLDWSNATSPLAGLLVVLSSEKDDINVWLDVLETAGCHVLKRLTSDLSRKRSGALKSVDVIVADKYISSATLRQAERRQIPIVSVEWVIQCLISGQKLSFMGHDKYAYNFD